NTILAAFRARGVYRRRNDCRGRGHGSSALLSRLARRDCCGNACGRFGFRLDDRLPDERLRGLIALLLLAASPPLRAHEWRSLAWDADPYILMSLALAAGLYAVGARRLWNAAGRGRTTAARAATLFWTGWTLLLLA